MEFMSNADQKNNVQMGHATLQLVKKKIKKLVGLNPKI